jgi:predicted ATP-dependent serine protease
VPVREGIAAFGEIGLTGRLRPAAQSERRLEECAKFGVAAAIAPEGTRSRSKIHVSASGTLRDALRAGLEAREENPRKSA